MHICFCYNKFNIMSQSKKNIIWRITLLFLLLISLGLNGFSIAYISIRQPDDFVFSNIALIVLSLFALFEFVLTLINFEKEPSLSKISRTERGYFNYIPLIAVGIGTIIAIGLLVGGLTIFFSKKAVGVRCNSLILIAIGTFLFINCFVYYFYILLNRKNSK